MPVYHAYAVIYSNALLEIEKGRRFFGDDAALGERKVLSKRALEVENCLRHEILRFKSGQLLRNLRKNLWFKKRNPGSKSPETVDAPGFTPDASIPITLYDAERGT